LISPSTSPSDPRGTLEGNLAGDLRSAIEACAAICGSGALARSAGDGALELELEVGGDASGAVLATGVRPGSGRLNPGIFSRALC